MKTNQKLFTLIAGLSSLLNAAGTSAAIADAGITPSVPAGYNCTLSVNVSSPADLFGKTTRTPLVVKEVNHEGEDWNIHVIAIPAGSPKEFDAYKNSVVYLNSRPSTGESMGSQITLLKGTRKLAMSTTGGHSGSPTSQLTLTAYDIDSTVTIRCDRSEQ